MSLAFTTRRHHFGRSIEVSATGTLPNGASFRRDYRQENRNGFDASMVKAFEKLARTQAYKAFEQACAGAATTGSTP